MFILSDFKWGIFSLYLSATYIASLNHLFKSAHFTNSMFSGQFAYVLYILFIKIFVIFVTNIFLIASILILHPFIYVFWKKFFERLWTVII